MGQATPDRGSRTPAAPLWPVRSESWSAGRAGQRPLEDRRFGCRWPLARSVPEYRFCCGEAQHTLTWRPDGGGRGSVLRGDSLQRASSVSRRGGSELKVRRSPGGICRLGGKRGRLRGDYPQPTSPQPPLFRDRGGGGGGMGERGARGWGARGVQPAAGHSGAETRRQGD